MADFIDADAQGTNGSTRPDDRTVRFYDSERALARIVADFLGEGFADGSPAIVIATADQRAEIVEELTARAFDVAALQATGDLMLLDGEPILSAFMVDGRPDDRKFKDEMSRLTRLAIGGRPTRTVRVFGQMVDRLWRTGDHDAAIRLELLWNQLARTPAAPVVCGYAIGHFYKNTRVEDVRATIEPRLSTAAEANRRASSRGGQS